jgi:hypothetical protein
VQPEASLVAFFSQALPSSAIENFTYLESLFVGLFPMKKRKNDEEFVGYFYVSLLVHYLTHSAGLIDKMYKCTNKLSRDYLRLFGPT